MKIGTKVNVCHDGKSGRAVDGIVVGTHNGYRIQIEFFHPGTEQMVTFWARRRSAIRHRRQRGYISYSRRPVGWAGWADLDWFSPWFTVSKKVK